MHTEALYVRKMSAILCPRCGTEAAGGKGFWGLSKPFCTSCGWNVALAKEEKRSELKQLPMSLLLIAGFFGAIAYFSKQELSLFPLLFFLVVSGRKWDRIMEEAETLGGVTSGHRLCNVVILCGDGRGKGETET